MSAECCCAGLLQVRGGRQPESGAQQNGKRKAEAGHGQQSGGPPAKRTAAQAGRGGHASNREEPAPFYVADAAEWSD